MSNLNLPKGPGSWPEMSQDKRQKTYEKLLKLKGESYKAGRENLAGEILKKVSDPQNNYSYFDVLTKNGESISGDKTAEKHPISAVILKAFKQGGAENPAALMHYSLDYLISGDENKQLKLNIDAVEPGDSIVVNQDGNGRWKLAVGRLDPNTKEATVVMSGYLFPKLETNFVMQNGVGPLPGELPATDEKTENTDHENFVETEGIGPHPKSMKVNGTGTDIPPESIPAITKEEWIERLKQDEEGMQIIEKCAANCKGSSDPDDPFYVEKNEDGAYKVYFSKKGSGVDPEAIKASSLRFAKDEAYINALKDLITAAYFKQRQETGTKELSMEGRKWPSEITSIDEIKKELSGLEQSGVVKILSKEFKITAPDATASMQGDIVYLNDGWTHFDSTPLAEVESSYRNSTGARNYAEQLYQRWIQLRIEKNAPTQSNEYAPFSLDGKLKQKMVEYAWENREAIDPQFNNAPFYTANGTIYMHANGILNLAKGSNWNGELSESEKTGLLKGDPTVIQAEIDQLNKEWLDYREKNQPRPKVETKMETKSTAPIKTPEKKPAQEAVKTQAKTYEQAISNIIQDYKDYVPSSGNEQAPFRFISGRIVFLGGTKSEGPNGQHNIDVRESIFSDNAKTMPQKVADLNKAYFEAKKHG